jgi:hypothetical protein
MPWLIKGIIVVPSVAILGLMFMLKGQRIDEPREDASPFEPWALEVLTAKNYSPKGQRLLIWLKLMLAIMVVAVIAALSLISRT